MPFSLLSYLLRFLFCGCIPDGIGFGITHSMVTMIFEKSMQLVNPKVSLPYWDFTIEAAIIDTEYDGDYTKARDVTDLWTADWFGGVDATDNQVILTATSLAVRFEELSSSGRE